MPSPPIPSPNALLVDPKTGIINKDWYDFFRNYTPVLNGTWTPSFTFATPGTFSLGAPTLSNRGFWTRVGSLVFYGFILGQNYTLGTATGAMRITGLPFTVAGGDKFNTMAQSMIFDGNGINAPGLTQFCLIPVAGQTYFEIFGTGTGLTLFLITHDNSDGAFGLIGSGWYWTDA